MTSYLRFFKEHNGLLAFGALMAFFSGYGQTFLISLFVPDIQETFSLSSSYFGTLYSLATVASALLLPWIGKKIDDISLSYFSISVAIGLLVSTGLLSISQGIVTLFIGLMGTRLFGQALCMHTSQTAMARYFILNRGKALSLSGLGMPLSEAVLPVTVAFLISILGWRLSLGAMTLSVLLLMIPGIILFLRLGSNQGDTNTQKDDGNDTPKGIKGMQWNRMDVIRNWRFYLIAPVGVTTPFLLTGLFLYQLPLAESKGWSAELMASGFIAFAIAKSGFSILSGPVIDRVSAQWLFPFILIPIGIGVLFLNVSDWAGIAFVYLFFAGMSQGIEVNVKNALYAELYGVAHLGAIRSLMSTLMVLSTAISPALVGYLIDIDIPFSWILTGAIGVVVINSLLAVPVAIYARRK